MTRVIETKWEKQVDWVQVLEVKLTTLADIGDMVQD